MVILANFAFYENGNKTSFYYDLYISSIIIIIIIMVLFLLILLFTLLLLLWISFMPTLT